uniref:Uncharacterized protein n=1 Tax=Anguilla anguilla TaxID=7936 RepID=A0A0E9TSN7_ANGAN
MYILKSNWSARDSFFSEAEHVACSLFVSRDLVPHCEIQMVIAFLLWFCRLINPN